jgi:parvulin-like peptidyl-prolyl isomerase
MRIRIIVALAIVALAAATTLAIVGCGGNKKVTVPADAIAVVDGQPILRSQYDQLLKRTELQYELQQKGSFPAQGTPQYEQVKQQVVQYLVENTVFEHEAKDMGIVITPAQVDQRLKLTIKQLFKGDLKKYRAELKKEGLTEAELKLSLRTRLLSEQLQKAILKDVKVSSDDIKSYCDKNASACEQPESRPARHILVKTKAEADRIEAQLKAGASFAALARKYSLDPGTKKSGGEFPGGVPKGQMVPAFDSAVFSLKTGQISKPIKTQYGWHIIEALGPIVPAQKYTESQLESTIKPTVLQQKQTQTINDWVAKAKKKAADETTYQVGYAPPSTKPVDLFTTTTP